MIVALVHEVFCGDGAAERLAARLDGARRGGAELAVLPELPLDRWIPATRAANEADAEPPGGKRERQLAEAARAAGIGLMGGAIVRDPGNGRRRNRAFVHDASGRLVASYDKLHVPCEEGFWEAEHYDAGDVPPQPIDGFSLPLGIQICSDMQRPTGCLVLGALGVGAILSPRATPKASYERWRTVLRADALASCTYVVSVNRTGPEPDTSIGGPSLAVAPDGEVLLESTDPVGLVELDPARLERARADYPGYLDVRSALYARAWAQVAVHTAKSRDDRP